MAEFSATLRWTNSTTGRVRPGAETPGVARYSARPTGWADGDGAYWQNVFGAEQIRISDSAAAVGNEQVTPAGPFTFTSEM